MEFSLAQIAAVLNSPVPHHGRITGWSVDSRSITPGNLFFALRGPNHDGNAYIDEVLSKGAIAVVAERNIPGPGPVMVVPDALLALQHLAAWARDQWGGDVAGITGSAGKTSTKDVIAQMLAVRLRTGKTIGNFNNHVGVPLSILRLPNDAEVAVLEIGMNHAGEILQLAKIARPRIGVVTNVGYAHIEAFESIEGIAAAKRELIDSLPVDGIAVLNADDPRVARFSDDRFGRTITFGLSEDADVRAEEVELLPESSRFRVGDIQFETRLPGRPGILNVLAGIAVAGIYGISPAHLQDVVSALAPGKMRGERFTAHGIQILNDCYNSNPDAARAMIGVLRDTPARRRIAVLGEMLELGRWSECLHRDVGRYVAECGIDVLVGIRGAARFTVDAAVEAGLAVDAAYFFDDPANAGDYLRQIAQEGDAILFKGSRGTRVELALERFLLKSS
jgi:UDP-N-acetylmuramoyl-tripeptide--D-alanyl-D-alanine ligase